MILFNLKPANVEKYVELLIMPAEDRWDLIRLLTIYLLKWRIWLAPNNDDKGQMGFNSAFEG